MVRDLVWSIRWSPSAASRFHPDTIAIDSPSSKAARASRACRLERHWLDEWSWCSCRLNQVVGNAANCPALRAISAWISS